jgi:hypothetical protein
VGLNIIRENLTTFKKILYGTFISLVLGSESCRIRNFCWIRIFWLVPVPDTSKNKCLINSGAGTGTLKKKHINFPVKFFTNVRNRAINTINHYFVHTEGAVRMKYYFAHYFTQNLHVTYSTGKVSYVFGELPVPSPARSQSISPLAINQPPSNQSAPSQSISPLAIN